MISTDVYLKERYSDAVEFQNENGRFDLNSYPNDHSFDVLGVARSGESSEWQIPAVQPERSSTPIANTSQTSTRRPLATVKVVRADIGSSGKPVNQHYYNLTSHIAVNGVSEACVEFIVSKVRELMGDESLQLVGSSGLVLSDDDGTRGNFVIALSFFVKTTF